MQIFNEAEEFLKNPRDLLSAKDAEIIEKHSSIARANKRLKTSSNETVGNMLLKASPNYDLLNVHEKSFCEQFNVLPSDYLDLKMKIIRV